MTISFGSHVSTQAREILEESIRIIEEVMPPHTANPAIVGGLVQAMATLIAAQKR